MKKRLRLSAFALKAFAIVVMTMNHVGHGFSGHLPDLASLLLISVGGATYMIMGFLLTEGYRHTRNVRRYGLRLLLFALLAQPAYSLHPARLGNFNVLFTLFLALAAVHATAKAKPLLGFFAALLCVGLSGFCDWAYMGVLIPLIYYWTPDRRMGALIAFGVTVLGMGAPAIQQMLLRGDMRYLSTAGYCLIGCLSGALATLLYSGERGGPNKRGVFSRYFFYAYYPAHLAAIAYLAYVLCDTPLRFTWPYPFS